MNKTEKELYSYEALIYNLTEDILVRLEDSGMSKKELAHRIGKSHKYIKRFFKGEIDIEWDVLLDIAQVLKFDVRVRIETDNNK
jgi:ribosome-binding protein aMBF1 (putative translation factor)